MQDWEQKAEQKIKHGRGMGVALRDVAGLIFTKGSPHSLSA